MPDSERCALGRSGRLGLRVPAAAIRTSCVSNSVEWNGFSYFSVADNFNSKSGYLFYLLMDQIGGGGIQDTLIEHATGFRVFS